MASVFGKAVISIAGKRYNTKEGASLDIGGISREPVMSDSGLAGSQEKYEAGKIECTIIATGDVSVTEIQAIKDASVSFDCDNGKSFISADAFNGPIPSLSRDGIKATIYGMFKEV